jgi:Niemann-Pick C1 protein
MNLYNSYLGGFPQGAEENVTLYTQSKALVATALVYNYYEKEANQPAIEWERVWIERMKQEAEENQLFDIYFMAETTGDILPVALSYSLMVIYVMLGINRWKCGKEFFVKAKFCVGFLGVICILLSVITTIGLFMWFGAKLHLIIMEVVPFLALAIGVDNIFLLVHAMDQAQTRLMTQQQANQMAIKKKASDLVSDIVSEALGEIGPSIFMASVSESVAFAFGCISPMPAVLWFAAFSAVAVLVNFILQMTILLSIMTLDKRRELSQRYDVFCCIKRPALGVSSSPSFISFSSTDTSHHVQTPMDITASAPAFVDMNHNSQEELSSTSLASRSHAPPLFDYCIDWYSWFLSLNTIKLFILLFSLGCTVASIFSIEQLQHGLPQAESMPSDSYMVSYFNTLNEYLATGPPIYFVVESGYKNNPIFFNFTNREMEAKLCKTKDFCEEFSIPKIIDALGKINPDSSSSSSMGNHHVVKTHFSKGVTYSWMDDFWSFVSPDTECCRVDTKTNAYLPVKSENQTYKEIRSKSKSCLPTNALPPPPVPEDAFMSLFRMFATASAGPSCSYGGGSIYRGQFSVDNAPIPVIKNDTSPVILKGNPNINGKEVTAFSYMVISTANPTQQDYIDLYKQSRRVAEWMSKKSGLDVWAYSIFFVFFDQYLTIIKDTYLLVGLALVAIFVIHCVYFCGLFYPLVVVLTVLNIVIQVMGLMTPLGIMLNGLSVVNLIIAAGISVEFCSHFVRLFAKTSGTGDERTREALRRVLSSVLFGITITKIVGLSALTLADSRIFQKYYFRMYMSIVLCGFINGMVLLPVILSVCVDVKKRFQKS